MLLLFIPQAALYTAKLEAVHAGSNVGVTSKMLRKACESTRPSTSPADRARFIAIYSKFCDTGKSGNNDTPEQNLEGSLVASEIPGHLHEQEALLGSLGNFGYNAADKRLATA